MDDVQLLALIQSLSVKEKAALCSGFDAWRTKANPHKGIPSLLMADGPHGLRLEDPGHEAQNGGLAKPATCFPPAVTLACSFSPALSRRIGGAIAEECLAEGVGLLLGPGVNIKRSPLGGRNFEYYSEDPLLAGEMAAGFINGLQKKGVGASLKHYAVNNQERYRMSINAAVDDRALRDLYLRPFEIAVEKAQPATVMASYNRVNGSYATQNRRLLNDLLRVGFGFTGVVVSDWSAVYNRGEGILAGLDLEMPASGGVTDWAIEQAVENGSLPEDALDIACWNLLRLIFRYAKRPGDATPCDYEAHHALAVEALEKSAVLLKNDGLLPLRPGRRVALIGQMADAPRYQGGGSSLVNARGLVGIRAAFEAQSVDHSYTPGYDGDNSGDEMIREAADAAKAAEVAIVVVGLPASYECESLDRAHLRLPPAHERLAAAVCAANPNTCVVLCCGAPVDSTPWLDGCRALLCPHLGGEGLGEAVTNLLFGYANPSGKLAESWPLALEDTPCFGHFPMGPDEVRYNESLYVGYRYYDTARKAVAFPFGFGLSYTAFTYQNLRVEDNHLAEGQALEVGLALRNTGDAAGEEVVQLYIAHKNPAAFQPAHELKAFARVALAPGEARDVHLRVPYRDFAYYDAGTKTRLVAAGEYIVQVGASSRELPLRMEITVEGKTPAPPPAHSASGPYGHVADNAFPDEDFAALYGDWPFSANRKPRKGEYTDFTPVGLMDDTFSGRFINWLARRISRKVMHFSDDPVTNCNSADRMAHEMPFKNIVLNSSGIVSPHTAGKLLDACNGRGSFAGFLVSLVGHRPYRKHDQ